MLDRLRQPQGLLIAGFLGLVAAVPLVQFGLDIAHGEADRLLDVFRQPPTAANLRAFERQLESANWAGNLTRPWVQFAQFQWLRDGGAKAVLGPHDRYFYKPGLGYLLSRSPASDPDLSPVPAPTQSLAHRQAPGAADSSTTATAHLDPLPAIIDFRDQLAARGIRLLLLPVPNKESIYPDWLCPTARHLPPVLAPRTRLLLDRLRAAHVEVVDLFVEFHRARHAPDSAAAPALYLAQDTHWSPAGLGLAANAVARRLRELQWLAEAPADPTSPPASTSHPTASPAPAPAPALALDLVERLSPVERLGDIVRMVQSPPLERRIPPETVPCRQVVDRATGQLFRESADARILVLGDSFLRVFQHDEPGAAGFVAHLAKELRQPLLSLVNDGGGSTLVRRELQHRPAFLAGKRVVVWEFVERDIGLGNQGWEPVPLPAP